MTTLSLVEQWLRKEATALKRKRPAVKDPYGSVRFYLQSACAWQSEYEDDGCPEIKYEQRSDGSYPILPDKEKCHPLVSRAIRDIKVVDQTFTKTDLLSWECDCYEQCMMPEE